MYGLIFGGRGYRVTGGEVVPVKHGIEDVEVTDSEVEHVVHVRLQGPRETGVCGFESLDTT